MEDIKISVIIPVYKVEPYLKRCVDSVRAQTHENLEIILVDDGSPDNCGAMCDEYAREDSRIRVIHKENGGLSSARNSGLDIATGDYIAMVDSDDYILPNMYETMLELMRRFEVGIVCCNMIREYPDGRHSYKNERTGDLRVYSREEAIGELFDRLVITYSACDKFYRREIFDNLRFREGIYYEDADTAYRLIDRVERIVYTGEPLYVYYQSANSTMRSGFSERRFDRLDVYRRRAEFYRDRYPRYYHRAQYFYVDDAVRFLVQAKKEPKYADLRRAHCKQLVGYVCKHPGAFFRCGGGNQKHLIFFAFGPSAHDFLIRSVHKNKMLWLRLTGRNSRS